MAQTKPKRGSKRPSPQAPDGVARVFWSGRSQAVRLPKAFRFDSDLVSIRQEGNLIILRSMTKAWGLAGLRLGYVIADEALATPLRTAKPSSRRKASGP